MFQVIEAVIAVTIIAELSIRKAVTVSRGRKKALVNKLVKLAAYILVLQLHMQYIAAYILLLQLHMHYIDRVRLHLHLDKQIQTLEKSTINRCKPWSYSQFQTL